MSSDAPASEAHADAARMLLEKTGGDLLEVAGLCRDAGIDIPWPEEKLALLNPFAVEFRYGFGLEEEEALDRNEAQSVSGEVLAWAKDLSR